MPDHRSHQVFISCPSHRGALLSAVVDLLASRFDEKGISYWVRHRDLDTSSEKNQRTLIQDAIRESAVFVPVLDGRKMGKTAAETNWQIEEAIAGDMAIVPFNLRKPADARKRSKGDGDWFDDLENVLEKRFDVLVRKVEALIGEKSDAASESAKAGDKEAKKAREDEPDREPDLETGKGEKAEEDTGDGERKPAAAANDHEERNGKEDESKEDEKEETDPGEAGPEAAAEEDDDGSGRITFPLPPPKVKVKKVRRSRKAGDDSGEKKAEAEESETKIDYPSRKKIEFSRAAPSAPANDGRGEEDDEEEAAEESPSPRKAVPFLAGAIVLLASLIGVQAVSSQKVVTDRQRNVQELELLGFSLNMYAAENGGRFPDSLDDLRKEGGDGPALRWRYHRSRTDEEFVYWPGFTWNFKPFAVVAAAPRPDPDGKRAVLYLNAEVRRMPEDLYQERLKAGTIGPPKPLGPPSPGGNSATGEKSGA